MFWFAHAPSNIALIKYMGKKNEAENTPINASLSYTLNHLISTVQLEVQTGTHDFWEPLNIPGGLPFTLPASGQQRFLKHLDFLKKHFKYNGGFVVRSTNNFPHTCGLASSASSFAALTKCATIALSELTNQPLPSLEEQAILSRAGSGSSCRSFLSPWALWTEETVAPIEFPYSELLYQGVVISHDQKAVSSSEAHKRVQTSIHYKTRANQANQNLKLLINALQTQDWKTAYTVCFEEFQEMHRLFETSETPFSYMTDESREVLRQLQDFWKTHGDGPLVTMDAGPNIHLLYRPDQGELARLFKQDHLIGNYDVL